MFSRLEKTSCSAIRGIGLASMSDTLGFLAHDIVILLDPAEIVENIHDAYSHPHFLDKAYTLLMSGPSGSADIAGITVHPARGVMTLTVIFWPRAQSKTVSQ